MPHTPASDVHSRARLSQRAKRVTDRFLTVMQGTTDLFWILNSSGEIQDDETNWSVFTGQQKQEAAGNGWLDAIYSTERPLLEELLVESVEAEVVREGTYHIRRNDGVYRLMHLRLFAVCTDQGTACEWVICGRDVTKEHMDEVQIQTALETSGIGLWQHDLNTHQFLATAQWKHLYGLAPDTPVTFETFLSLLHTEDRTRVLSLKALAHTETASLQTSFWITWPDGSQHWITNQFRYLSDRPNCSGYLIGSSVDITELKTAEEQISDLLSSITDTFVHLDQQWRVTYANAQVSPITGRNWETYRGQSFWEVVPSLLHTSAEKHLRSAMKNRQNMHFDFFSTKLHIWIEIHAYPTRQGGLALYVRDITTRKQAEATIRERERQFRHLINSNIIGIIVVDLAGAIYEANDAFLTLTGYTQADLTERPLSWKDLTPKEYETADEQALEQLASTGISHPYEKAYVCKDGTRVPVLVGGTLIRRQGKPSLCLSFVVDLTAQKELDHHKDVMLSITSHELKTPLAALKGMLQLVQRRLQRLLATQPSLPPQWGAFIEDLQRKQEDEIRQVETQTRLINSLLDASRIATNTLELSRQKADLVNLVRTTVEELRFTAPERTLHVTLPAQPEIMVWMDQDCIREVLTNYLTNALRYAPSDQPILVGLGCKETMARVWVQDHGPGLSEGARKDIWQRYHKVKGTPTQDHSGKGLGLGLYICKEMIRHHKGEVGVESAPGKGATFWFTLPLIDSSEVL